MFVWMIEEKWGLGPLSPLVTPLCYARPEPGHYLDVWLFLDR